MMPMQSIQCSQCGQRIQLIDDLADHTLACPQCGWQFVMTRRPSPPAFEPAPPADPPAAAPADDADHLASLAESGGQAPARGRYRVARRPNALLVVMFLGTVVILVIFGAIMVATSNSPPDRSTATSADRSDDFSGPSDSPAAGARTRPERPTPTRPPADDPSKESAEVAKLQETVVRARAMFDTRFAAEMEATARTPDLQDDQKLLARLQAEASLPWGPQDQPYLALVEAATGELLSRRSGQGEQAWQLVRQAVERLRAATAGVVDLAPVTQITRAVAAVRQVTGREIPISGAEQPSLFGVQAHPDRP
ncbi:MAG: hypothetical protein BIFFINMI_01605 [Phycisphaerae bacterium]|nr:hypothetical protein [Phycisphaerae bacterium]